MSNLRKYIKIRESKIPVIVRNYKKTSKIKLFFNADVLNIIKPKWYSINKIIKDYGDELYNKYVEITSIENNNIIHFITGEKVLYKGKFLKIIREENNLNKIRVVLDEQNTTLTIMLPKGFTDESEIRKNVIECVKNLFKNKTTLIIEEKIKFWSQKMNLEYESFKVNDTLSKYGSCMPKSKRLFFSLRLVMLPDDIIDLIVVHELAHLVYPNHSKDFYNLLRKYISDYGKKDKWLKENSNLIMI